MSKRFEGKVAIVTGGSQGIGEAIVRRLVQEGARVYSMYVGNPERPDAISAELAASGGFVKYVAGDVCNEQQVREFVEMVIAEGGRIDAVVNNAGVTRDNLLMRMSEADWDLVLNVNLKGVFTVTKAVVRQMMSQRNGRIVNITSVVGITGNAGQSNYSASKAGLIGFSKSTAKEFASRNILVNCIAPGYIETDMTAKLSEEQRKSFSDVIPLKRGGSAADIAGVVSFLLSDDASYITGQVLCVDGGMVM